MAPADILSRAGIRPVLTRLPGGTPMVAGSHGLRLESSCSVDEISPDEAAGIFLPGGMPGTRHLGESAALGEILRQFHSRGKLIAAICAAPTVLHGLGMLRGMRATSHPSCAAELRDCRYVESPVVVDRPVITSRGPGTALLCGLTLVACLSGARAALRLAEAMMIDVPGSIREEWSRWATTM
ncbi:MAG: DJ-1/PfpI family protein [Candidatus Eisenbacteria bacterium]|nr:DJ-1/PfpI family protein [Candidatus Eisenbacteria bacterium]